MAIKEIPVDQRIIDVDSRRFAAIDKALVELITNSRSCSESPSEAR